VEREGGDVMDQAPPRIGLTTYRETAAWGIWNEAADLLPSTYADSIAVAGGLPMLLPPVANVEDLAAAARSAVGGLHGLVISGGADVDPGRYDAPRDEHTGPERADRDSWELALVRAATDADLPLLGVCRGMQVMAVAFGGTLIQHLPDVVGNETHCPTVGEHGRHDVTLADGSRLAGILGRFADVATYHHQAVGQLPDGTVVATGWAEDGTIEAFEGCDQFWLLGVQWHPEVHNGQPLFRDFVAASRTWRDQRAGEAAT
jgi:putative glutamine amidotransferase